MSVRMSVTFGDHLIQFVQAVDIVDEHIKDSILGEIKQYLDREMGVKFFTLSVETTIEGSDGGKVRGLRTTDWHLGGDRHITALQDIQGRYLGQVSLAFDQNQPLWIVSNLPGEELRNSEEYRDLWSKTSSETIPKYVKKTTSSIRTSIIVPLRVVELDRNFGVVNFESEKCLAYSESVRDELLKIVDSITKLYDRNQSYMKQKSDTREAIQRLNQFGTDNSSSVVNQRRIFLASSSRAENDVMGIIQEVADKYDAEVIFWQQISETGIINLEILKQIKTCQYGICYLSEIINPGSQSSETRYKDNPNVLIEAGILSAKSENFENVIPIREKSSGDIPFDIASNRILFVNRNKAGQLNENLLRQSLSLSLDRWFKRT